MPNHMNYNNDDTNDIDDNMTGRTHKESTFSTFWICN